MVFSHENAKEAGRRGGKRVVEKYGVEYLVARGRRGGAAVVRKYGLKFMREIAAKGGRARADRLRRERED